MRIDVAAGDDLVAAVRGATGDSLVVVIAPRASLEMALGLAGVPHAKGGVQAAMESLTQP